MFEDYCYSTYIDGKHIEVPPIDELCAALKEKFLRQSQRNMHLSQENADLKSGEWTKEEMSRMKSKYEEMKKDYYRGFPISEDEQKSIDEWQKKHDAEFHNAKTLERRVQLEGVSGGRFTYRFVPTSIGTVGEIRCSCGECFTFRDL